MAPKKAPSIVAVVEAPPAGENLGFSSGNCRPGSYILAFAFQIWL